jgi:hypothetical protein
LLNLAIGIKPRLAHIAPANGDPFEHPDALRRFRAMKNVEELALALDILGNAGQCSCIAHHFPLTWADFGELLLFSRNQMARMTTETLDEQARIAFEDIVIAVKGGNCNLFLGGFL